MVQIFEYENNPIQFDVINGKVMANATLMAAASGKKMNNYLRSKSTAEYISSIEKRYAISRNGLIVVKQGGLDQGTWIHEKLILDFARWCSPDFAVWCDEKIATLMREGHVQLGVEKKEFELLSKQTERPVQIQNSKDVNAHNFQKGGKTAAIEYNRQNCFIHTGYLPHEVLNYAKKMGVPSKQRTSAKEIFRNKKPAVSASMSLADEFCKTGNMAIEEAATLCKQNALPLFQKMSEIGLLKQDS